MLCLVSGGADSTCLFHALRELDYRVEALHVDHGLRGDESDADAAWCAEQFGAEVVQRCRRLRHRGRAPRRSLLVPRRCAARDRPHAVGPGRDDRLPARGARARRRGSRCGGRTASCGRCSASGARRPRRSAASAGSSGGPTPRIPTRCAALIRNEILPLLERIHPAARENVLRALDERRTMPPALAELLGSPAGSKRIDLGGRAAGRARVRPGLARAGPASTSTAPSSGARGGSSRAAGA